MFTSPALREFQVVILKPYASCETPFRVAYVLLEKLLNGCSSLRTLALFPDATLEPQEDELSFLQSVSGSKSDVRLGRVNALREMSISLTMLAVLLELDCPPFSALEHLSVYASSLEDIDYDSLGQHLFPNVRRLSLFNLMYETTLHEIWRALGSTVNGLTHVELHFHPRYWPRRMNFQHNYILLELVSFLIAHSPRIVDLRLYVPPLSSDALSPISGTNTITLLGKLPLERLYILGAYIGGPLPHDFRLGQAFGHLKSLELPHHRISTSTLYQFADAMPRLEYLSMDLRFNHDAEPPRRDTTDRSTTLRHLESSFQESSPFGERAGVSSFAKGRYTSALGFARYLRPR